MKMRYTLFDAEQGKWLMGFQVPERECDAVVTWWTRKVEKAMRFPGVRSARRVARMMGAETHGVCEVRNARGVKV